MNVQKACRSLCAHTSEQLKANIAQSSAFKESKTSLLLRSSNQAHLPSSHLFSQTSPKINCLSLFKLRSTYIQAQRWVNWNQVCKLTS